MISVAMAPDRTMVGHVGIMPVGKRKFSMFETIVLQRLDMAIAPGFRPICSHNVAFFRLRDRDFGSMRRYYDRMSLVGGDARHCSLMSDLPGHERELNRDTSDIAFYLERHGIRLSRTLSLANDTGIVPWRDRNPTEGKYGESLPPASRCLPENRGGWPPQR